LLAEEEPEYFEEVEDPSEPVEEELFEETSDMSTSSSIPAWAQTIIQNQQAQLDNITRLLEVQEENAGDAHIPAAPARDNRPVRAEYIYDFSPADSPDDMSYHFFIERINDMVAQYDEERVLPSLVSCLKNERARMWYASLSDGDKNNMRASTQGWKNVLKRDFGIKPFRAKQLAAREKFSFSQGRSVLNYFDRKIACLRISGVEEEDMQCHEIKDGIKDPELRSLIRLHGADNSTAWLRQELIDTENDAKSLWQKNQRAPPPPRPQFQLRRGGARGANRSDASISRDFRDERRSPAKDKDKARDKKGEAPRRGAMRGRGAGGGRTSERLAITASASERPPRPCRFCGGNHWDRDCNYNRSKASVSAYHCYHLNIAEEAYEAAEQEYEALQAKVFHIAGNHSSGEEEEDEDDVSEGVHSNDDSDDYFESEDVNFAHSDALVVPNKRHATRTYFHAKVTGRVMHVDTTLKARACESCGKEFPSRNKLFAHLRTRRHQKKAEETQIPSHEVEVIESDAPKEKVGTGYAFRDHHFTEIKYRLSLEHPEDWGCLDSGSSMSLVEESILSQLPWTKRTFLKEPVEVQGIGDEASQSNEAVTLDVYFPDHTG